MTRENRLEKIRHVSLELKIAAVAASAGIVIGAREYYLYRGRKRTKEAFENEIDFKLSQIQSVFNIDEVRDINPDNEYVREYYKTNQIAYSIFHTFSDRVYMGISREGIYKPDDLLETQRFIEKFIKEQDAESVLEIATGRGAIESYLAQTFPKVRFDGLDLSPGQLEFAIKRASKLKNYHPELGDYHDLSRYKDATYDVAYQVEALCYSKDKEKVFRELWRVLKPGGVFIMFDGYSVADRSTLSEKELAAAEITEKGMAVPIFEQFDSVIEKAKSVGFKIEYDEDASMLIMPTLRRFERLADFYFAHPEIARRARKFLPDTFTLNAVAGYLMPNLIEQGIARYGITVLRKPYNN